MRTTVERVLRIDARRPLVVALCAAVAAGLLVTTAIPAGASVPVRCSPAVAPLAGGAFHSVVADGAGKLRATGDNTFGTLGDGTYTTRLSLVPTLDLAHMTAVSSGPNSNHTLALRSDGAVWAWGMNWYGQVGNGELGPLVAHEITPQRVQGVSEVVAVAAGGDHSLALTEGGTVYAWGRNHEGQLGIGNTLDSPVPVQVIGLTNVIAIGAGSSHSLAVTANGRVHTWGRNSEGQLGLGYVDELAHPLPAEVPGLTSVTAVAGGGFHSLALRSTGVVRGWGLNDTGQVGAGFTSDPLVSPTAVTNLTAVTSIAAGYWHSMGLKSDGSVWTWGYSSQGQLGNGWYGFGAWNPTPMQVSGIANAKEVAAGGSFSLALRNDGRIYGWGANNHGQLGRGDTTDRTSPVQMTGVTQQVPDPPTKVEAVAGERTALVTWEQPDAVVTQYVVTPYRNGVAQAPIGTKLPKLEFAAPDLTEGATYWFEVRGQNCLGEGAASAASNRVVPTEVQLHDHGFSLEGQRINDRHALKANVFNGNLKVVASDLLIAGRGLSLSVERVYNSRASSAGVFGNRWSTTVGTDVSLEALPSGSVYLHDSGATVGFADQGTSTYVAPAGIDATLTKLADGTYTLTFHFTGERWRFGTDGKLTSRQDRNGNELTFTYDTVLGRLTSITDTQGRTISFTYDLNGRISQMTDHPNPLSARTWKYGYDGAGNLTTYTDPENKVTAYAYDAAGNLTAVITPGGGAPGTRRVTFTYDSSRLKTITWPEVPGAPTTEFAYEAGRTIVTDANDNDTTYRFDAVGRTTKVVDQLGNSVSTAYTSNSNVRRHSIGGATTHYDYSGANALTAMNADTGARYELTYGDAAHPHLPTVVKDPQGHRLQYAYDSKGNVVRQTNDSPAPDNRVDLAYNANGTLQWSQDARKNRTTYGYDSKGNVTSIAPPAPLGGIGPVGYDALARISSFRDGKGMTSTLTYDRLDRIKKITYPDGSSVTYTYDGDGNVLTMVDPSGTTTMTYDERNRLSSRSTPDGKTITYDYDGTGNLKSITEDGRTVTYSYSAANLLSGVIEADGAATQFSYDADYNRVAVRYPNGVSIFSSYDGAKRLTKITSVDAALSTLTAFEYSYAHPATGNDTALRQSVTDHEGRTTKWGYDELNRLTRATTTDASGSVVRDEIYRYDGTSNRLSQTIQAGPLATHTFFQYNAANQLVNNNGVATLSYDGNGNLTGSSIGEAYTYNAADQTTSIRTATGVPSEYAYRGAGQGERATVNLAGSQVMSFAYGTLGLSSETLVGASTTYFTRSDSGQVLSQHGAAGRHYFLPDGLGSTVGLTDDSGRVVARYRYDSFGNQIGGSGATEVTRLRYAGQYLDLTGLYKMGERYYDPALGRWTQQDPLHSMLDPGQWNRYVYVGADPINYRDPTGLCRGLRDPALRLIQNLIISGAEVVLIVVSGAGAAGKLIVGLSRTRRLVVVGVGVSPDAIASLLSFSARDAWDAGWELGSAIFDRCEPIGEIAPGSSGNPFGYQSA